MHTTQDRLEQSAADVRNCITKAASLIGYNLETQVPESASIEEANNAFGSYVNFEAGISDVSDLNAWYDNAERFAELRSELGDDWGIVGAMPFKPQA